MGVLGLARGCAPHATGQGELRHRRRLRVVADSTAPRRLGLQLAGRRPRHPARSRCRGRPCDGNRVGTPLVDSSAPGGRAGNRRRGAACPRKQADLEPQLIGVPSPFAAPGREAGTQIREPSRHYRCGTSPTRSAVTTRGATRRRPRIASGTGCRPVMPTSTLSTTRGRRISGARGTATGLRSECRRGQPRPSTPPNSWTSHGSHPTSCAHSCAPSERSSIG